MPGATDRPNWCLPLPVPTEELAAHPGVQAVAAVLAAGLQPVTTKGKVKAGKSGKSSGKSARTGLRPGPPRSPVRPAGGQLCRNASRSALIVSASVVGMPCGKPW